MAFVQSLLSNAVDAAGTGLTLSGSKTVTAGNDIVVAVVEDRITNTLTIADNLGNTYTEYEHAPALLSHKMRIFRAHAVTGGTLTTITLTWNLSTGERAAVSLEYDGLDAVVIGDNENTATSTSPQGTTPTGDGTHLFVCASSTAVTGSFGGTFTPPTGYTTRADNNSSHKRIIVASQTGNLSGNKVGTFASSTSWIVATIALAAAVLPPALTAAYSFDGVTVR